MRIFLPLVVAMAGVLAQTASAQVRVQAGGASVNIGAGGGVEVRGGDTHVNVRAKDVTAIATEGNNASVNIGGIGEGVNVQGVTIINGRVTIDGKEIPTKVTRYKSPRTGEVYVITRKDGAVDVTTEAEVKK